jgi:tetratricopeptide (TPR) repeat protein
MKKTAALLLALALSVPALRAAEVRLPQASPAARVGLAIGVTDVEITYHRPGVKGRGIWGGLVPYGEVWRLGANDATTISFSTPVKVEGHDVPAGKYSLFAIPGKDSWTLVLNKTAEQWGAYSYKKEDDLLRFDVKPQAGPPTEKTEWMVFSMTPASETSATVEMAWESLRVPFTVSADVDRMVWNGIDSSMAGKPDAETYLTAVQYAMNKGVRLDDAMAWTDKALALEADNFWGHEFKAKLLQKQGKVEEAIQHLDKAMETAKGKAPQEYIDGLAKLKKEWKA